MEPYYAMTTKNAGHNDVTLSERSEQCVDFFVSPDTLPDGDGSLVEGNTIEDLFFKAIFKPSNFTKYNDRVKEDILELVS